MADIGNSAFSETDASNNSSPPNGAPEGWSPAAVNDTQRAVMGADKRAWNRINPTVTSTGSAGAYVYTPVNASFPVAYVQGETYAFKANFTSIGGDTLNVNALGALGIYKTTSAGVVPIVAGDIQANSMVACVYDVALNSGGGGFQMPAPAVSSSAIPAGAIMHFGGSSAPAGWLFCDGSAVSRTTFSALFAVIGTTYGTGNGSTTFNIPDGRGRVLAGFDSANATGRLSASQPGGVSAAALANSGGEQAHALAVGELALHNHGVTDPTHGHTNTDPGHGHGVTDPTHAHSIADPGHGHGVNDPGHVHAYTFIAGGAGSFITYTSGPNGLDESFPNTFSAGSNISIQGSGTGIGIFGAATGISINGAVSSITVNAAGSGISIQNAGSGTAHNTVQPTLIVNHIIKT